MDLILTRKACNPWGIISDLTDYQNVFHLTCLEHAYLNSNGTYSPKVPDGIYPCVLGAHTLLKLGLIETYEIMNVPGHSGILFHIGNFNDDSDGCLLLGESLGDNCILNSREAFNRFISFQNNCTRFMLTITSS